MMGWSHCILAGHRQLLVSSGAFRCALGNFILGLITPRELPSAPSSHPHFPIHLLLSIAGAEKAKRGVMMAQPWGKMSSSPGGKVFNCFISPVPRTLGKACAFWAGDSFKGEQSWHRWQVPSGILG